MISFVHLSFPGVPSSLNYFTTEIHLNHYKALPCVLNFSFFSLPFVYRSSHEGSTWWFIKDLYSFSKCSSGFFSKELKHSSSCNPECNFFLPYLWRWYYVILDNLSSCFMIHMLLRMRYFKSINLVIGVTLGYISPKAFPKDFCYYGAHRWPKFFFYPPGDITFSSPCSYQSNSFSHEWQVVTS